MINEYIHMCYCKWIDENVELFYMIENSPKNYSYTRSM